MLGHGGGVCNGHAVVRYKMITGCIHLILIFFLTFPLLFHDRSFKIKDLLHASWHERDMCRGHELQLVLPLKTTHKVPVTAQKDVEDTKI